VVCELHGIYEAIRQSVLPLLEETYGGLYHENNTVCTWGCVCMYVSRLAVSCVELVFVVLFSLLVVVVVVVAVVVVVVVVVVVAVLSALYLSFRSLI
jgi:hypothetical protein